MPNTGRLSRVLADSRQGIQRCEVVRNVAAMIFDQGVRQRLEHEPSVNPTERPKHLREFLPGAVDDRNEIRIPPDEPIEDVHDLRHPGPLQHEHSHENSKGISGRAPRKAAAVEFVPVDQHTRHVPKADRLVYLPYRGSRLIVVDCLQAASRLWGLSREQGTCAYGGNWDDTCARDHEGLRSAPSNSRNVLPGGSVGEPCGQGRSISSLIPGGTTILKRRAPACRGSLAPPQHQRWVGQLVSGTGPLVPRTVVEVVTGIVRPQVRRHRRLGGTSWSDNWSMRALFVVR